MTHERARAFRQEPYIEIQRVDRRTWKVCRVDENDLAWLLGYKMTEKRARKFGEKKLKKLVRETMYVESPTVIRMKDLKNEG